MNDLHSVQDDAAACGVHELHLRKEGSTAYPRKVRSYPQATGRLPLWSLVEAWMPLSNMDHWRSLSVEITEMEDLLQEKYRLI